MSVFNFFKSYFYLLKHTLILSVTFLIITDVCRQLSTYFGSRLIGLISKQWDNKFDALPMAITFILLYAFFGVAKSIIVNLPSIPEKKSIPYTRAKISKNLFAHIHQQAPRFFEQEMSGNITNKIQNITYCFENVYFAFFWSILHPLVVVSIVILSIMFVQFSIGFILLILFACFYWMNWKSAQSVMPFIHEMSRQFSLSFAGVIDSISNVETVKSFAALSFERRHLFKQLNKAAKSQRIVLKKRRIVGLKQGTWRSFLQFIFCVIPLFYWYFGYLTFADYIFIQGCVITIAYQTGNLAPDIQHFLSDVATMQEALDLVYQPMTLTDAPNASDLTVTKGHIQIKNMEFEYVKNKRVFKNFSLDIKSGTRLGLIGYSGSGKSSLIKLINRTYDVTKGSIFIDGQNIHDVTQSSLHRNIAYIPQEPSLLNRTIKENIKYAKPDATDDEIITAAKKAYCHDFIMKLPNGYDSKVGERGVMLSGGERQRIAIARAILKNAPILILDEATSALDSESERYIQRSLENLMAGKTVIAIAHRLSTLKKMTRLIVLENGKITEDGSHSSLMKNKQLYYQFYKMQTTTFIGD